MTLIEKALVKLEEKYERALADVYSNTSPGLSVAVDMIKEMLEKETEPPPNVKEKHWTLYYDRYGTRGLEVFETLELAKHWSLVNNNLETIHPVEIINLPENKHFKYDGDNEWKEIEKTR